MILFDGDRMSDQEQMMVWSSTYVAYVFCRQHCTGALRDLDPRLSEFLEQTYGRRSGDQGHLWDPGPNLFYVVYVTTYILYVLFN